MCVLESRKSKITFPLEKEAEVNGNKPDTGREIGSGITHVNPYPTNVENRVSS